MDFSQKVLAMNEFSHGYFFEEAMNEFSHGYFFEEEK